MADTAWILQSSGRMRDHTPEHRRTCVIAEPSTDLSPWSRLHQRIPGELQLDQAL